MLPLLAAAAFYGPEWVVYQGTRGPGKGKHIVFLSGDDEYRSEEGLPQLARILATRHGFQCTVLFSIGKDGMIDPNEHGNEPGLEALDSADLCVILLRFRSWPDAQMKHFVDYYLSGKPIIALRTSTHAFDFPKGSTYARYGWNSTEWPGGFGKQVLGETWVSHWGAHKEQTTRAVPVGKSPLLRGVGEIFCTTDVYEAAPPADAEVVMNGLVLSGMRPADPPATNRKKTALGHEQAVNDPPMPVAWTREPVNAAGKTNKVFTCTMGAATDLLDTNLRRLLVNAAYWGVGLDIPRRANVDLGGKYEPSPFGFDGFRRGVKPSDLQG